MSKTLLPFTVRELEALDWLDRTPGAWQNLREINAAAERSHLNSPLAARELVMREMRAREGASP
jgi:hypothetical protein